MPTDLDDLLAGVTRHPDAVDVDGLWAAGRRRRRVRHMASAAGGLASIAVMAVVIGTVGFGGPATPEVSPLGEAEEDGTDAGEVGEVDEAEGVDEVDEVEVDETEAAVPSDEPDAEDLVGPNGDAADEGDADDPATDGTGTQEQQAAEDPGPAPDDAAMANPCATQDADDFQSFIDVVSPVANQSVDGAVELVGCSRVPEGTVRYRVFDGDRVLVDSFTTATFGGPELGEFRESIPVDADGELTLEVFWDSPASGEGERDLVRITFRVS